jgi:hypothetical protein
VAEGTPEQIVEVPESHTGRFLRRMLDLPEPSPPAKPARRSKVAAR